MTFKPASTIRNRSSGSGEKGTTRRWFFASIAAGASGAAAMGIADTSSAVSGPDDDRNWVSGEISEVRPPDQLTIDLREPPGAGRVDVRIGDETQMTRDGNARLADFQPGDVIAVKGQRRGEGSIAATRIQAFCYVLHHVSVESRSGRSVRAGGRQLELDGDVRELVFYESHDDDRPTRSPDDVRTGDVITVFGRPRRRSDTLDVYGLQIEDS
jgi:uncharacterized protein YndB with AHSA1/START domain